MVVNLYKWEQQLMFAVDFVYDVFLMYQCVLGVLKPDPSQK